MLTLRELLTDPRLQGVQPLAAMQHAARHAIGWFSLMDWPLEDIADFVRHGDIVMTTGTGCDADRFTEMIRAIVAREPAGILFSPSDESPVNQVPQDVLDLVERAEVPLVKVPWKMRFVDIARAVADRVLEDQTPPRAMIDALAPEFVHALLEGGGAERVVEVTERLCDLPVVALSAELEVQAAGSCAQTVLDLALNRLKSLRGVLPGNDYVVARKALELDPGSVKWLEHIGLPPGTMIPAMSRRRTVGYIYATASGMSVRQPDVAVLRQGAQALALAQISADAIAEANTRWQGDVLWSIARGGINDAAEIRRRASLVGLPSEVKYRVAVGIPGLGSKASNDEVTLDAVTIPRLRRHVVHASRSQDSVLLLFHELKSDVIALLADAPGATWGIADEPQALNGLCDAYARARDTAVSAMSLGALDSVSRECDLRPYLLLARIWQDDGAQRTVRRLIDGLLASDRRTEGNLVGTLTAYLQTNGNASQTARSLHLHRQSLLYRLHKIEKLTGYDLGRHEDRFTLDLALRLWKIGGLTE